MTVTAVVGNAAMLKIELNHKEAQASLLVALLLVSAAFNHTACRASFKCHLPVPTD